LGTDVEAFVIQVEELNRRFEDVGVAIAEGYRKIGPDFPGMGEHWIHPSRVIAGTLDPRIPAVLTYAPVGVERQLIGFAYTRVLAPGAGPPELPFPAAAWHDHSGEVDEESLLLSGPASMHPIENGYRLSMVHIWKPLKNQDGILAQNNWALPFLRAGLPIPLRVSSEAARALSLAGVGMPFYEQLLRDGIGLEEDALQAAMTAFAEGSDSARAWRQRQDQRGKVSTAALEELEAIWGQLWEDLRHRLSDNDFANLAVLGPHALH
jgi:hypothetical protein